MFGTGWDAGGRLLWATPNSQDDRCSPRSKEAADLLSSAVRSRSPRPANLDLALAVLVVGAKMPPDAGELILAVPTRAPCILGRQIAFGVNYLDVEIK
jgi:hypothetical protein